MFQENGAAPAGWTAISIAMIPAHKRKVHGVHPACHITKMPLHLAGTLFVDDATLEHFNMSKVEAFLETHTAL
jgi:hypothetical protein